MLKREVIRISFSGIIGVVLGFVLFEEIYMPLVMGVYSIGVFYAGKLIFGLIFQLLKKYVQIGFMNLILRTFWLPIVSTILFSLALAIIVSLAWIIGVGRCVLMVVSAVRLDEQLHGNLRYR